MRTWAVFEVYKALDAQERPWLIRPGFWRKAYAIACGTALGQYLAWWLR